MPEEKFHKIDPTTLQRARDLRNFMSPYERILWERMKNRQVSGLKFRRQHQIGPFIVDFYCAEARLVIEIDGDSHEERQEYDNQRTAYLFRKGCRVIRFSNEQVKNDCEEVIRAIVKECANAI